MSKTLPILIGLLLVLILVLFNTTYTVNFHEVAVRTRFGKPAGVSREPGLHWKMPFFIDSVTKLDTRLQLAESPLETVLTKDGQQVVVQAYLLWQIDENDDGAMGFFTAFRSVEQATKDLEQQLQGTMRLIGGFTFGELVGAQSKLPAAEEAILKDLQAAKLVGVRPVSVGISSVLLPPKTTVAVLNRMAEVQNTLARYEEGRGKAEAEALKGNAKTQADAIRAFAGQWASEIRARGEAEAAPYYEAMRKYRDLAMFLAWLDAFRTGLSRRTTFVADQSRAPFHLANPDGPTDALGIPVPAAGAPAPSAAPAVTPAAAPTRKD